MEKAVGEGNGTMALASSHSTLKKHLFLLKICSAQRVKSTGTDLPKDNQAVMNGQTWFLK